MRKYEIMFIVRSDIDEQARKDTVSKLEKTLTDNKAVITLNKELGEFIFNRINDIVVSTAKMFRGEAELIELSSVPPLTNNTELAKEVTSYLKDLLGEKSVVLFESGGMGSEDFASYSYEVPSVYLMLGAGTKQENSLYGEAMHNPKVVFNEDILVTGAAMHTYCAITWLRNN